MPQGAGVDDGRRDVGMPWRLFGRTSHPFQRAGTGYADHDGPIDLGSAYADRAASLIGQLPGSTIVCTDPSLRKPAG